MSAPKNKSSAAFATDIRNSIMQSILQIYGIIGSSNIRIITYFIVAVYSVTNVIERIPYWVHRIEKIRNRIA